MHLRWALVSMLLAWITACAPDEQPAPTQTAQISQLQRFAGTQGFDAHVAAGSTILVAIESPDGQSLSTNLNLDLVVTGTGQFATIAPVGVAQYAVTLTSIGYYNLVARNGSQTIAVTTINVASEGGLGLSSEFAVVTSGIGPSGRACTTTRTLDSLTGLVLDRNQSLSFSVVPLGTDGSPMLGTLTLTATGDGVSVNAPPIGAGSVANALSVMPLPGVKGPASVHIRDQASGATTRVDFVVSTDLAPTRCD